MVIGITNIAIREEKKCNLRGCFSIRTDMAHLLYLHL